MSRSVRQTFIDVERIVKDLDIDEVGTKAAQLVTKRAKELVPVRTGALRESIHVHRTRDGRPSVKIGKLYGLPIHEGFKPRGRGGENWEGRIPGKPFLRQAAQELEPQIRRMFGTFASVRLKTRVRKARR